MKFQTEKLFSVKKPQPFQFSSDHFLRTHHLLKFNFDFMVWLTKEEEWPT